LLPQLCRNALKCGTPPELTAALPGVTEVKLFLGGRVVCGRLTKQELVDLAAAAGMSVVLPTAQGLEILGAGIPAAPL
jgi:hypothetical protein